MTMPNHEDIETDAGRDPERMSADERRAACDRIAAILGLDPAGMSPGSHRPAPTATPDIRAVRAAFILPAPTSAR